MTFLGKEAPVEPPDLRASPRGPPPPPRILRLRGQRGHCAARRLKFVDAFVVKYSPNAQRDLAEHVDGSRFSATVVLSQGSIAGGVRAGPDAGSRPNRHKCAYTKCRSRSCGAWVMAAEDNASTPSCAELDASYGCECGRHCVRFRASISSV